MYSTWLSKKVHAKFSDTCSVRADGLCIGSPRLVGGRKLGNSNMQEFFGTTLYSAHKMCLSTLTRLCLQICGIVVHVSISHIHLKLVATLLV